MKVGVPKAACLEARQAPGNFTAGREGRVTLAVHALTVAMKLYEV